MSKIVLEDSQRKRVQELEIEILSEIDRICKKYDIKYTLAYGTLIGTIRHRGFIPWDDDIDIAMTRENYEKFKKIAKREMSDRFFYQTNATDPEYFHLFDKVRMNGTVFKETFLAKYHIHHGVYVDILPIDNIPDSKIKFFIQYGLFHLFRTGLMAKYLDVKARTGKKKIVFSILRMLYFPFSTKMLYKNAIVVARKYEKKPGKRVAFLMSPYHLRDVVDSSCYKKFTKMPFEGKEYMVVSDYDYLLTSVYGDYMKLPPLEKQTTRHDLEELKI